MSINDLAINESSAYYYTREIRNLLESHLEMLINHPETKIVQVSPNIVYKYEGDLFGLLTTLKIPVQYHWIIMRMNRFTSPTDLPNNKIAFLNPNFSMIDSIINMHRTSKSVNS